MMPGSLKSSFLLTFAFAFSLTCTGQESIFKPDIEHIKTRLSQTQIDHVRKPYIYRDEPSVIKKYNPVSLLLGGTLYLYQNILSKHISADCLFTPSCSEFSKLAIREEGLLKGILLSIDRVNRCNRIAETDLNHSEIDPKTGRFPDPVSRHRKAANH